MPPRFLTPKVLLTPTGSKNSWDAVSRSHRCTAVFLDAGHGRPCGPYKLPPPETGQTRQFSDPGVVCPVLCDAHLTVSIGRLRAAMRQHCPCNARIRQPPAENLQGTSNQPASSATNALLRHFDDASWHAHRTIHNLHGPRVGQMPGLCPWHGPCFVCTNGQIRTEVTSPATAFATAGSRATSSNPERSHTALAVVDFDFGPSYCGL
mmetsp:Transcript_28167/g.46698  ORF Transcript_28167/g.46698 Transcript_28167/m.46698 type:complete len:207 (-) Transcript_28167:847-1467(-)